MQLNDVQNGSFRNNNVGDTSTHRDKRADRLLRFYKGQFHLFVIPISIIIAIIHLKFGIEYFGQCTIQPLIITYMITHASVIIVVSVLAFFGVITARCIYSPAGANNTNTTAHHLVLIVAFLTLILMSFSFAWLVAGSVWVFGAKSSVQGSDFTITTTYCPSDLYRAAFLLIIVNYVVHVVVILLIAYKQLCRNNGRVEPPLGGAMD